MISKLIFPSISDHVVGTAERADRSADPLPVFFCCGWFVNENEWMETGCNVVISSCFISLFFSFCCRRPILVEALQTLRRWVWSIERTRKANRPFFSSIRAAARCCRRNWQRRLRRWTHRRCAMTFSTEKHGDAASKEAKRETNSDGLSRRRFALRFSQDTHKNERGFGVVASNVTFGASFLANLLMAGSFWMRLFFLFSQLGLCRKDFVFSDDACFLFFVLFSWNEKKCSSVWVLFFF